MSTPNVKNPEVRVGLVFFGIVITMLLSSLNQTILSTALPTIVGDLRGVDKLPWVMTSFILASTMVMPIYGKIGDLVGRKSLLLIAISIFLVGTIIGGLAVNIDILLLARAVQGIGGGGLMILSQATIADIIPPRERGKYSGIMGGVFAFSTVAGPLIGGWLTEGPGWRSVFWFNIPLGLAALFVVTKFLHLPPRPKQRVVVDYLGMLLLAIICTGIVVISIWGGHQYAWNSFQIIGLFAIVIISIICLYFVEGKAEIPVMPRSLFRESNFRLTTSAGLLISIAMFGAVSYMPTYFQFTIRNIDAQKAGLLMIPMMGSLLVSSIITGRIVTNTGKYKIFPICGALIVALALFLLSTVKLATHVWVICVYLGILGVGLGMSLQILVLIVQNTFSLSMVGTAIASNNYFRQIGATLGASIVGSVFTTRLVNYIRENFTARHLPVSHLNIQNLTPNAVKHTPSAVHEVIVQGYNHALIPIFLYLVPLAVLAAFVLSFIHEKELATKIVYDKVED